MQPTRKTSKKRLRYRAALSLVQRASGSNDPAISYDAHDQSESPLDCVYLLHFASQVRGKQHYLGVTTCERSALRMREHANGRGSSFTRHMMRNTAGFYLARMWIGNGYELEAKIKRTGHLSSYCPICRLPSLIDKIGFSFFEPTIPVATWAPFAKGTPT